MVKTRSHWQERTAFTKKERALFAATMQIQSPSRATGHMQHFVRSTARSYGATVTIDNGNVYITKGSATVFPCLVAHSDQVHTPIPPGNFVVTESQGEWWANDNRQKQNKEGRWLCPQVGIGGDDKVGVYIALNAIRTLPAVKVAIFRDEEVGCLGAAEADLGFFADCAFILECDRRGTGDFVDTIYGTDLVSPEFRKAVRPIITKRGFSFASGAMTDVQELTERGVGICTANMSCGYYNPHTNAEFCVEREVLAAQLLVTEIIDTMGDAQWTHAYTAPRSYASPYGAAASWGDDREWGESVTATTTPTSFILREHGFSYQDGTWVMSPEKRQRLCLPVGSLPQPGPICSCGGNEGYVFNAARNLYLCVSCAHIKPFGIPIVPWWIVPERCPHCGVGNGRLMWSKDKHTFWCLECLGHTDGTTFVGESRIENERRITMVLRAAKQDVGGIDESDPAQRTIVREALKQKGDIDILASLSGGAERAEESEEADDHERDFDEPALAPDACTGCGADGQEMLVWDPYLSMYHCLACEVFTMPLDLSFIAA